MRRYFIINHQDTATVSLVKSSQQTTSFTALLFFYDSEGKQGCMFGTKGQGPSSDFHSGLNTLCFPC